MSEGPSPDDPVYIAAARGLLERMHEVCDAERTRCNEVVESWPSEIRMFPASPDTAEGTLYMPRAVPPVYLFQSCAHRTDDGDIETHIHGLAPYTQELLDLAIDYQKRAAQHLFTCTCGHIIPKMLTIPLDSLDEEDITDAIEAIKASFMGKASEDEQDSMTADDFRLQDMVHPQEVNYACPACGFKPNKRYNKR